MVLCFWFIFAYNSVWGLFRKFGELPILTNFVLKDVKNTWCRLFIEAFLYEKFSKHLASFCLVDIKFWLTRDFLVMVNGFLENIFIFIVSEIEKIYLIEKFCHKLPTVYFWVCYWKNDIYETWYFFFLA